MRILLFGGSGRLGQALQVELRGHQLVCPTHAQLDVRNEPDVRAFTLFTHPHAVLNCASDNEVDRAERDAACDDVDLTLRRDGCTDVNGWAPHTMAAAAAEEQAVFVQYSTDFVFDGVATEPYVETDAPNPLTVYGAAKLMGEREALEYPRAYVLRVASLFGGRPKNPMQPGSVEGLLQLLATDANPPVIVDRTTTISHVFDVARATRLLLEMGLAGRPAPFGVYHCVSTGVVDWSTIAGFACGVMGKTPRWRSVRYADMNFPTPRPMFSALSNLKLAQVGVPMPHWKSAVFACMAERGLL